MCLLGLFVSNICDVNFFKAGFAVPCLNIFHLILNVNQMLMQPITCNVKPCLLHRDFSSRQDSLGGHNIVFHSVVSTYSNITFFYIGRLYSLVLVYEQSQGIHDRLKRYIYLVGCIRKTITWHLKKKSYHHWCTDIHCIVWRN